MSSIMKLALILCLAGAALSIRARSEKLSVREKLNRRLENLEVGQIMKCEAVEYKIGVELRTHRARYDTCNVAEEELIQEIIGMGRTKAQLMGLELKREIADYVRAYSITDIIVSPQDRLLNCLEGNAGSLETSTLRYLEATSCEWISENLRRRRDYMQREIDVAAREYWKPFENN